MQFFANIKYKRLKFVNFWKLNSQSPRRISNRARPTLILPGRSEFFILSDSAYDRANLVSSLLGQKRPEITAIRVFTASEGKRNPRKLTWSCACAIRLLVSLLVSSVTSLFSYLIIFRYLGFFISGEFSISDFGCSHFDLLLSSVCWSIIRI